MPFNTFGVATAVTPSVIETYFSHYLNRKPLKQKPTAHISYHEGLRLIRQFLDYSSKHSIEDLQAFTAQWVPAPTWVWIKDVEVPPQFITRSANIIRKQLGSNGIEKVGGEKWWQWRRPETPLHAEWIEMKKDATERKRTGAKCEKAILYVHGGAYYFGSVDEHRYQMQRHARKLKARVLAPRYRLAPQFPFPCGLHDCIATYFYLLEHFDPSQILFAGDSAGGGMVLSMLVVLRDQGCPLPAGTILLSPWVDLTHSFPSTSGNGLGDYIPPHGFHHKPSMAWPPPPSTDTVPKKLERTYTQPAEQAFDVVELPANEAGAISTMASRDNLRAQAEKLPEKPAVPNAAIPGTSQRLEIQIDDKLVIIREQIQMYAKNDLLSHPLVSPVQQPSLGGLPPMLIQVGGAELLRDEQIYLAHKAARPTAYVPSEAIMNEHDPQRTILNQYPPTDVQLQVWEDLCHVPHTLSFTRPAKYMYRSVAQFGAWALAQAQHKAIENTDEDVMSIISDGEDVEDFKGKGSQENFGRIDDDGVTSTQLKLTAIGPVGKAGDNIPPFKDHMIRQRVNRHGIIFPLPNPEDIKCLHLDRETIGAIKSGPVRKWLRKRAENEQKFASEYKKILKKKTKEMKDWDSPEAGEAPPATAMYNRRKHGVPPEQKKKGKSWGLAMWSGWGSSHDETTIEREEKFVEEMEKEKAEEQAAKGAVRNEGAETTQDESVSPTALVAPGHADSDTKVKRRRSSLSVMSTPWHKKERDESRTRDVQENNRPASAYRPLPTATERVATASPTTGGDSSTQEARKGFWDLSRRSSSASGKGNANNRPVSTVAPIPVSTLSTQTPSSANVPSVPSAPSMYDTGKEAVKVAGSENTFLSPESSRPHNGTVAYPFKLSKDAKNAHIEPRAPSPNPSTMTLDSNEASDKESSSIKSTGLLVAAVELPTNQAEKQGSGSEASPAALVSKATVAETDETVAPGKGTRPVSLLADNAFPPSFKSSEEDTVSPIGQVEDPITAAAGRVRHNKFESRDSRIGQLGADGMPTAAFPEPNSDLTAMDSSRPAPFKIRNPVFDPRAGNPNAPPPLQQPGGLGQPAATAQPADGTKAVPFKVRNPVRQTIYGTPVNNGSNGTSKRDISPFHHSTTTSSDLTALPPVPADGVIPVNASATAASNHSNSPSLNPTNHSPQSSNADQIVQPKGTSTPTAAVVPPPIPIPPHRPAPLLLDSNDPPPTPPPKDTPPPQPSPALPAPLQWTKGALGRKKASTNNMVQENYSASTSLPAGAAAALAGPQQRPASNASSTSAGSVPVSRFYPATAMTVAVPSKKDSVTTTLGSEKRKEKEEEEGVARSPTPTSTKFPHPPKLGNLSFENLSDSLDMGGSGNGRESDTASRPPLETFITAREALDK